MDETFLTETIRAIKRSGHKIGDVVFIGSVQSGHSCSWTKFRRLADFTYDSGFGTSEVASDLVVVFKDGKKLWRGEYDGSEWWEFDSPLVKIPKKRNPITKLHGDWGGTLEDLHDPEYDD